MSLTLSTAPPPVAAPPVAVALPATPSRLRQFLGNRRARIGLAILVPILILVAIAPLLPLQKPLQTNLRAIMQTPSLTFPFGTDRMGRDVLSRTLEGIKVSLFVGLSVAAISLVFGVILARWPASSGGRSTG